MSELRKSADIVAKEFKGNSPDKFGVSAVLFPAVEEIKEALRSGDGGNSEEITPQGFDRNLYCSKESLQCLQKLLHKIKLVLHLL